MYSFKFYYIEACDTLKIRQNQKLLSRIEESTNTANLNLSSIELTDDTCKAIGQALKKDVFLQKLDLSSCMFNDDGLSHLLSGLEANKFLLSLNLKENSIRGAGTAIVGRLLRHNNHLENLNLEWNPTGIFSDKFSYLCEGLCANTSLKSLDLRNNQLNQLSAQSLSEVISRNSTLQYLDLRWNSIGLVGGRAILKTLSNNNSILKLEIDGNNIPAEIQKSIEFITTVNAERYLKNSEDMKKTRLFASKLQLLEEKREKEMKTLKEELQKKNVDIESIERWNSAKLNDLQEILLEKDKMVEELTKRSKDLQNKVSIMEQEKNEAALAFNEVEIKNKEFRKEINFVLDKEKKEKEEMERKLMEELGIIKEENMHLKKKIEEFQISEKSLADEVGNLKNTLSKVEKTSKLAEKSHYDEILALDEKHAENLNKFEQLKKNEIIVLKEEFSETEKRLKEQIMHLENRTKDLEKQIIERDDLITGNKEQAEKAMNELKSKMKADEDKLRKQMEERIELLESANKKLEEILRESQEAFNEIQKKCLENNLLLKEESQHKLKLERMLKAKDAEMEAAIAEVKLELNDQIDKLNLDNNSLKLNIEELAKKHKEEKQIQEEDINKLQKKIQQLKMELKAMFQKSHKLQNDFDSFMKFFKQACDKEIDLEDELNISE